MTGPRLLAPLIAALCGMAITSTASEPSCVVDVESALALSTSPKTTDVIPLVEGSWRGDVYVLPYAYPETYDRLLPGGVDNIQARQWVAQSFLAHNPDAYDFIAVVTGFPFDAGWGQLGDPTHALYWGVKNDTSGLGLDFFDHSTTFGSHRLQGYIDANDLDLVRDTNGLLDENHFLTILSHELGHRWLAYCDYQDNQGAISSALRGVDDGHWSYLLDSDASYMYGAQWHDNLDGSFTATEIKMRYSELDLYLMGMLTAEEVEPFTLLVNPSVPADQYPELGATITATPSSVTAADVIAAEGPRHPSADEAPHELRIALVYLVAPGNRISAEELDFLTAARHSWQRRFFAQTEGRGIIGAGRNSLPVVSPPTLDLAAAVAWLLSAADGAGLWQNDPITRSRDSAAAIAALDAYGGHAGVVATALGALASIPAPAIELEAWQTEPLARHAHPAAAILLDQLGSWVLDEGAWGGGLRYAGDTATTARVARALAAGGRAAEANQALAWITDRQNTDGGWSWREGGPSAVAPTLEAIHSIVAADPLRWNDAPVQNAVTWLLGRRTQGGFGEPHPDVAQTALFLAAAHGQAMSQEIIDGAVTFLAARQRSDGSFGGSVHQTAQAVTALAPYVQPDLAVSSSELLVEPENPFIEDQLTLLAAVHALNGDVPAGVSYRWEVIDAAQNVVATLDGVLPPIPATLFATVTDTWNLQHQVSPGTTTFRFTADALQEIAEPNEDNNSAELPVTFGDHSGWIDLVLTPDEIQATPGAISSVPQRVVIDGVVRNTGWAEARDAVIAVMEVGSSTPLATTTTTVPSNGEAPFQLTIELAEARPYQLAVIADPDDLLNDVDPSNNRAELSLGVAPTFDPAVIAGSFAVTPSSGVEAGDLVILELAVVNLGTQLLSGLQIGITYTTGDPPGTTPIQLLDLNDELDPGDTRTMTVEWRPPVADPNLTLGVEIDPFHLVDDTDRSNNSAEISFAVAPSPLPNLVVDHATVVFDPEPALQHESVHISAAVANPTDNAAGAFTVRIWIDEIGAGVLVAEIAVPGLTALGTTVVETDWPVDEMADRVVWIDVDGDDEVPEFNEDDNRDFRVLDVRTIPDLVVTSGQVSLQPRFPHTGDVVHVEIAVLNTGDQTASGVEIEFGFTGGAVIATTTIPTIEGGDAENVAFDWSTDGVVGDVSLRITADPSDTVVELDEDNNTVEIAAAVQDADLWVTERFISPNGDGTKDSTTIFVRENVTTIEVVDPWSEVVTTLDVDSSGQAVWDGRKSTGAAVRDGVYELVADGLRSWVEVDLNGVTITDDIRRPLIVGSVPKTSAHPAAEFTSAAPSPVDGIVYLNERIDTSTHKMWRWSGEGLEDVLDWPTGSGHTTIRQMSAHEDVFITWNGAYSLVRFPGPSIDPLPLPVGNDGQPHLSPDGEWILWVCSLSSFDRSVVLQRVGDLGETYEFGPFSSGFSHPWNHDPTVHWSPNGGRVVVTMHHMIPFGPGDLGLALDILPGDPPSIRELVLDQACGRIDVNGNEREVAATVDFESNELMCTRDSARSLEIIDLQTGSTKAGIALPALAGDAADWYLLSNDGRVLWVGKTYVELKRKKFDPPPPFLFDWQRGIEVPSDTTGLGYIGNWSILDRYSYSYSNDFFTYRTPAANLAITLDPVIRFGGSGIDLFLTVTDKNLDHYQLEFAPASDPDAFEALGQPARGTIFGESWGTWIPPEQGTWRLRLTAADLAGNQRSVTRWVTWNGISDIAGLWTESRHISPVASPGVLDQLVWQYTVLRPAQLLFEIVDESDALLRSIPVGAAQPGPVTTTWDGRDDAGRPVPDGSYRLVFRGAEWPVTVDNTPPVLSFEIDDNGLRPSTVEITEAAGWDPPVHLERSALFNSTVWSVADENLADAVFETRHVDQTEWAPVSATALFAGITAPASREAEVRAQWWSERVVRQTATDRAGNRSLAERLHREEQLAFAFAEPPCRSEDEPCLFPNRPEVNALEDADGLMDDPVAVLWPHYSTLLVQSTVWGQWRDTLRLEFRAPEDNGLPAGDWQLGTLELADQEVWRRPKILTGNPFQPTGTLGAKVLPVYWEHQGLPLRPYEVRLLAENRDGDEITGPTVLVVPKAPLAVEYLSTDAGGDHFRVHNIGTVRIDDIMLKGSRDALSWLDAAAVGSLEGGHSTLVTTGCGFLDAAIEGTTTNWIRVEGIDPWGAPQRSLPAPFQRAGPPAAVSRPSFSMVRAGCGPGSPPAEGMMGYDPGTGGPAECTSWSCELGWHSAGNLVDLQITVPAIDPNGTPIAGYELLLDGAVIAGAPELVPGATGRVILDLQGAAEGQHIVSERYLFAPGDQGMLAGCVRSAALHVDRTAVVSITNPVDGQSLCPDQGQVPILTTFGELAWRTTFSIDGSTTGIGIDPTTHTPVISVPELDPGSHVLEASVVDLAGNAACASVEFFSEGVAAVTGLDVDPPVFSPINTLGRPTETVVSFGATAQATYVIEIRDELDDSVVASGGMLTPGEIVSLSWDGTFEGVPVADGDYGIWIRLESDCGAVFETPEPLTKITVDTEGPTVVVTNPWPGAQLGTALELQAMITDPHFEHWEARIKPAPPVPGSWTVIASGDQPSTDPNNVLVRWSATHLPPGDYVVEIEAADEPGNRAVTDEIPLVVQTFELIESFEAMPIYFSPDSNGVADTVDFHFELLQEAEIHLTFEGWVTLIDSEVLPPGTTHTATWDGLDPDQNPSPDGVYNFTLDAFDVSFLGWETDFATVIIDRTPPEVVIASPQDGSLKALPVTVSGFTDDPHADVHSVTLMHPDGSTTELSSGPGNWSSSADFTFSDLPDGGYRVTVTATDLALNSTTVEHEFVIDNTAPSAQITAPDAGRVLDPSTEAFVLRGTIGSAHPQGYAWWIAEGASPEPADFVLVFESTLAAGGTVEYLWTGAPPADGTHTIRLTALDQLGRTAEDRRIVTIDSDDPMVEIWAPAEGSVITEPVVITGQVDDGNLSHWTLEEVAAGETVRLLAAGASPAMDELITWDPLPEDGVVALRLTAHDHAGHSNETSVNVEVSVLPPEPPVGLTAQVVNGRDAALSWAPGPGPAPVGYHVVRNGIRITTSPIISPAFTDLNLLDGAYSYQVTAIGAMGRESDPSDPATVVVNLTPPAVALTAPANGSRVSSEVEIYGAAFSADDFAFWEVSARAAGAPGWIVLDTATAPVLGGFMTSWITHLAPWSDGPHEIRLAAEDTFGNRAERVIPVIVDNTAPDPGPANLQAHLVALDGDGLVNDIQLSWTQSPTPPDLAGFYLYRNGLLANAGGPIIGDPTPYLLPGTSYDDKDVPDGSYTYGVVAADTAGNVSALSNPAGPITVDLRRPHALIVEPAHGAEFEGAIEIVVECEDDDVVSLDLEYRLASQPDWTPMAPTFTGPPYVAIFTPPENDLYYVRALAADAFGPDPAPHIIEVVAADLPPAAPLQVTVGVAGGDVTLTWIAPPDPGNDLMGFEIMRDGQQINAQLIPPDTLAYLDSGLNDGAYDYRVVALDQADQRGSSGPLTAVVLTPFWNWVAPVGPAESISLTGGGAHPFGSVEIQRFDPGEGIRTIVVIEADEDGAIELDDLGLNPGANPLIATSGDDEGNTSRISLPLLIVSHLPPQWPENLVAVPTGSDVSLSWTTPPDPESAGFSILRAGSVINEPVSALVYDPALHTLGASAGDPATWELVIDGNPATGWAPTRVPTAGTPEWWSWSWPDPVEIDEVIIGWSQTDPPQVFDVEVLTGGGWLWLETLSWDGQPTMTVPAGVTSSGLRIRLPMTGFCGNSSCLPVLTEIGLTSIERTIGNSYLDEGLPDGIHTYEVTQRNIWGQESWSSSVSASVGSEQPLPPTDLTVTPMDCGGLEISWQPAGTQPGPLTGFRLYRSDTPGGPADLLFTLNASQTGVTDADAPVGEERHYAVTSRVMMGGAIVESQPSTAASGTASCLNPPPPVITHPTVAGQPIQIDPSQAPIRVRGNAVSGSVITLLHDEVPVVSKQSTSVFVFDDIEVHPGSNSYVARQELHGTVTDSAPIIVELDPSLVSDLVALSFGVAPGAAAPGELVMAEAEIELLASSAGDATFNATIELEDPSGTRAEIHRTRLVLTPGERRTIRTAWSATGPAGLWHWRLVVDADDEILELDEDNNLAIAPMRILEDGGAELSVGIDQSTYLVGRQLTGEVLFAAAGPPEDYLLESRLEDAGGRLVAILDSRTLTGFGGDWLMVEIDQPLVGLYPGLYRVRAAASVNGVVIAEDLAPFLLEQPYFVEADVTTDRSSYPEGSAVAVDGRIHNLGPSVLDNLVASLSVVDVVTGQVVGRSTAPNIGVAAEGTAEVGWSWSSAGAQLGAYRATLVVSDAGGTTLAVAEDFPFTVLPGDLRLTAAIDLSASPVEPGDGATATVTIENTGTTDLPALNIACKLIDPIELQIVEEHLHTISLDAGAVHVFDQPLDTSDLVLRRYVVLVTASGDDGHAPFNLDLGSATLEIADLSPPVVVVIEPAGGGVACEAINITADVDDTLSRVSRVYHHLDDETTAVALHLEDPSANPHLWSATRPLPPGLDGSHRITVHAEDAAGNLSDGEEVSFDADTAPPVLQVTGPANGSCVSGEVVFSFIAIDAHLVLMTAILDGQPYASGSPITAEGTHFFEVMAADACGRQVQETSSFIIDSTAPEVVIQGVTHGGEVMLGTVLEWSVTDPNLVSTSTTLDGVAIGSPITLDTPGPHTLHISADDCASNTVEVTVQFTVIEAILALSGAATASPGALEPGESLTVSGTVTNGGTELEMVQLVLDVVQSSTSTVVATRTETVDLSAGQTHEVTAILDTTGWELGVYEVRFAARGLFLGQPFDLALAATTATLADLTAPELSVISPSSGLTCRDIEVVAEATDNLTGVLSVTVAVDGGSPLALTHSGGNTWSAALVLDEGLHDLALVARDGADNTSAPLAIAVDLDTEAPVLSVTAPDDGICLSEGATIEFAADDPHLDDVTATLNGVSISSGHVVDEDGSYDLSIVATDECGLETTDDRQFVIDTVNPEILVTGLTDGEAYATGVPAEWSASDDNLSSSSAMLDGVPVDPSFTVTFVGVHLLVVAAQDCAGNTADREISFETVLPEDGLSGTVTADPNQVEPPATLLASANITNTIDTPYPDLSLSLEIIEASTGQVIAGFETTANLPVGAEVDIEHEFATTGLSLGEYELRFSASGTVHGNAFSSQLASQVFEVVDLTAPTVTLLSPDPGIACGSVEVRVAAEDALSGISGIRLHIDGDPEGLPLAHTGGDIWAIDLTLDEGAHHLAVVARDGAGNQSDTTAIEIDLDLTPPILTVEAPTDGSCLAGPATISFSAEDLHLEELRALLNGTSIGSGAVVSIDGDHHLLVSAFDACGRSDTHVTDFVIDATPPVITVTGVADGGEYPSPVEIGWTIDDAHLVSESAILDGEPVAPGIVVEAPGSHTLAIEARDCADNQQRIEVDFTLIEDPHSGLEVMPTTLTAGGSILLLDRSPGGGEALEQWLADHAGHLTRVTDACIFITELRRARHELVVLYSPTGAVPLDTPSCRGEPEITDVAWELSALAYRRGGMLVLGEGMAGEGCLGCLMAATGTSFHNQVVDRLEVEGTTSILEVDGELALFDLRPLDPERSFPLLLGNSGGVPTCNGVKSVTLELAGGFAGRWAVEARSATPHEVLDAEIGELLDGERLDESTHEWVDLAVSRTGEDLSIELRSTSGGALPDWLALTVGVATVDQIPESELVTSAWVPVDCGLGAGQVFDLMKITAVEAIGRDSEQTVAATGRRYGRGEAQVLPWDVLASANEAALPVVEQALRFSLPSAPWSALTGLPLPITFGIRNGGTDAVIIRIDAAVPLTQLIEAWGDPLSIDPVRWEFEVEAGETATRTVWLLPTAAASPIEVPTTVSVGDGETWTTIETDVVRIEIESADRRSRLRDLRGALDDCAQSTDDPAIIETLRDLLAAVERVAVAGEDRMAAEDALRELSRAFAATEDEALPCLANLRGRLADLIALWQAQWVTTGSMQ